jgi:S-adenosylmethionine:tRNA ribosyltransferase-isomerase
MDISLFNFELPKELIAQEPAEVRDRSRLMVIDRKTRSLSHRIFAEVGDFLPPGATLLRNNARVLPARLRGTRPGGGAVECVLVQATEKVEEWWCLARPGRKLRAGARFGQKKEWSAEVLHVAGDGQRLIRFRPAQQENFLSLVNRVGEMPLPPYIHREKNDERVAADRDRYQTVYAQADKQVAAAAPTAGLHFTSELEADLRRREISFGDLTLHIGLGTFQPIKTQNVEDHAIHREIYEIPPGTRELLSGAKPGPLVAVGTTVTRAVEDYLRREAPSAKAETFLGEADIYIYPPFDFRGVDSLITNFHLPRSSLLCLVSAFLAPGRTDGIAWLLELYAEAIRERYRFFSYGDAMLIL